MKLPKINWSFIKGFVLALITAGIIYFGYNLGMKIDALEKAWKYPEAVREMQVSEVIVATYSGEIKK